MHACDYVEYMTGYYLRFIGAEVKDIFIIYTYIYVCIKSHRTEKTDGHVTWLLENVIFYNQENRQFDICLLQDF